MTATMESTMNQLNIGPAVKLLGEVISWTTKGRQIPVSDVRTALTQAGLDESVVRDMLPRNAFSRSCKELAKQRIIRVKHETDTAITFQFTAETKDPNTGQFNYNLETEVDLEKTTGIVTCSDTSLQAFAQNLVNHNLAHRTAGDVTKVVQKLFENNAALFPVRDQGGVYFVPDIHKNFTEQVEKFLQQLGGHLKRFPVPAGTAQGTASVQASVCDGIQALIEEHMEAIDRLDPNSRDSTIEHRQEEIEQTKFKIEAYKAYLAERQEYFEHMAQQAEDRLKAKVEELLQAKNAEQTTAA